MHQSGGKRQYRKNDNVKLSDELVFVRERERPLMVRWSKGALILWREQREQSTCETVGRMRQTDGERRERQILLDDSA